ncbi:PD-(D/E)XK nuclease family protein [bacterium]|nr:PD-(D/E)XK nuclease family protein [bacterium]
MLRLIKISSPDEKKTYFASQSKAEDLWVVSHIEAKKWIQEQYLKKSKSIATQTVLRATEYWQWLFSINCPEWRTISESLIYASIEDWFEKNKTPAQLSDIEMFYNFTTQLSPILYSEQKQLFEEWLQQDGMRQQRLMPWYQQAVVFQQQLLQKKWIGKPWLLSFLNAKESIYWGEFKSIHFDLGLDLQHEEVDMILRIAKQTDVQVLMPDPSWVSEYAQQMSVYHRIEQAADELKTIENKNSLVPFKTIYENSVLNEIKSVVANIRQLLDHGVTTAQIALGTAALEDYWPLLKSHFDVEGIPVNKRVVARAIALPSVQVWLSRLRLLQDDFNQAQLQAVLYLSDSETSTISYHEFKKNFTNLYATDSLRETFQLQKAFAKNKVINLADFVEILYAQWENENDEILSEIIDRLIKDMNLHDELSFGIWLKYLELVVSRYEIPLYKEHEDGIQCYGLNAMDWHSCDHVFILGCEQKLLVQTQRSPLQMDDLFALERDLGFYLQKTESHKIEFDLRWCLQKVSQKNTIFHSESDFNGEPQLASHYWMKLHMRNKETEASRLESTRWDQLMVSRAQDIHQILDWQETDRDLFAKKISMDKDTENYSPIKNLRTPRLSAGQLQKLDQCAFLFFAEKILKLKAHEEYDLEIDPMYNGQILHAILEKLILNYPSLNVEKPQVEEIYESVLANMQGDLPLQTFWRNEKKRQLNLIYNFIELEKEYRQRHPQVKTAGVEVPISGFLTDTEQELLWSKESVSDKSFSFSGKIDRLDQDGFGNFGIIDYKTSKTESIKGFSSWLNNSQFQMSIYAKAIENGLAADFTSKKVVAADYIFLKNKKRGSGFIIDQPENGFVGLDHDKKTISIEEKQNHDKNLQEKLKQLLAQIEKGIFPPKPKDTKICEQCHWSALCRAPHLR